MIPLALCNQRPRLMVVKAIVAVLIPCNSWLLLLRVRAVPPQFLPRFAVITCTILWATTLTSFLIFPGFGVSDVRNQDGVCSIMTYYDTRLLSAPFVTLLVFDTASTIVVSLSLASYVPAQTSWSERIRSMMHIEHMGQLSKVFLRSGQIYYLYAVSVSFPTGVTSNILPPCNRATFGIHLGVSIVALSSAIPSDYSAQLGLISCTYHNIMTCRVYRLLKLGLREGANGSTFDVASHNHSLVIFHRDDNATPIVVDTHMFPRM